MVSFEMERKIPDVTGSLEGEAAHPAYRREVLHAMLFTVQGPRAVRGWVGVGPWGGGV